jgi:hypothetical protein
MTIAILPWLRGSINNSIMFSKTLSSQIENQADPKLSPQQKITCLPHRASPSHIEQSLPTTNASLLLGSEPGGES